MTRDILDYHGTTIGQLTLPDDTSENDWTLALNHYNTPIIVTQQQIVVSKVDAAIDFGTNLVFSIVVDNILLGIVQAGKTKEVSDYSKVVARYLKEGSLYAALSELDILIAAGAPPELAPFVTIDRMTTNRTKIAAYLGM